MIKRSGIINN